MNALMCGAAQIDITPDGPIDLSGFAARTQPSIGVLDPIYVKAIFLQTDAALMDDGGHTPRDQSVRLLWLGFDLLALSESFVNEIRAAAKRELNVDHVLFSATHTHAAPHAMQLLGCGDFDSAYLTALRIKTITAAKQAIENATLHEMVFAQADHVLAKHRRGPASEHVDSRVSAIGFRKPGGGDFETVILNYPMHPVALGHVNRKVSADWCAGAATKLAESLPGNPIAMITNGAAGNLNPPGQPEPVDVVHGYGEQIADAIIGPLLVASPAPASIRVAVDHVELPLEVMSPDEIDRHVEQRADQFKDTPWADQFPPVLRCWADTQKNLLAKGKGKSVTIELFAIDLGPAIVIACSGELFSRFTAILREKIGKPLFVVGYANAAFGYIASRQAYTEPGYEVDDAHLFYNHFRAKSGGLEMLADRAVILARNLNQRELSS